MSYSRIAVLTILALAAFAGNSLLCRAALAQRAIDPATFTTVRLLSGAVMLRMLVLIRGGERQGQGNWISALALFTYAAAFSFSYVYLTAAAGALILFGAVQTTMIGYGLKSGERLQPLQILGFLLACGGLVALLLPGFSAPPMPGAVLMLAAGVAWGAYSLRGKAAGDPLRVTTGNFIRTVPMALILSALFYQRASFTPSGITYALLSGALTSGLGYAVWYMAVPFLRSTSAATVQLSVPVIAAMGGVIFLQEPLRLRLLFATIAIIGGIGLVILKGKPSVGKSVETGDGE